MARVVVTGVGALTPLGADAATLVELLNQGHSGIRPLTTPWIKNLVSPLAAPVLTPLENRFSKLRRLMLDRVA